MNSSAAQRSLVISPCFPPLSTNKHWKWCRGQVKAKRGQNKESWYGSQGLSNSTALSSLVSFYVTEKGHPHPIFSHLWQSSRRWSEEAHYCPSSHSSPDNTGWDRNRGYTLSSPPDLWVCFSATKRYRGWREEPVGESQLQLTTLMEMEDPQD